MWNWLCDRAAELGWRIACWIEGVPADDLGKWLEERR